MCERDVRESAEMKFMPYMLVRVRVACDRGR
jgi:hypothetical protein